MNKMILLMVFAFNTMAASAWQMDSGTHQKVMSGLKIQAAIPEFDNSTWKLQKRICVRGLAEADLQTPTKVYDIADYHQTWIFQNGIQSFLIHNASRDANKCATQVDGSYAYVTLPNSPFDAVLGASTERRRRVDCPATYTGPSLGLIHLIKWSDASRTEFRDSTLAGTINNTVCPDVNDYLVTVWKKYEDLPLH